MNPGGVGLRARVREHRERQESSETLASHLSYLRWKTSLAWSAAILGDRLGRVNPSVRPGRATGGIENHLIVPPQPLEEAAHGIAARVRLL